MWPSSLLPAEPDLGHEVLVVPEQPFVVHRLAFPVANRDHADRKTLPGRGNGFAVRQRHRLGEGPGHHAGHRCPGAGAEANRMSLDGDVRGKDEQRLQVLDVPVDALGLMTIGPGHDDVCGMALLESIPFLIAEDIEVERVEDARRRRAAVASRRGTRAGAPGARPQPALRSREACGVCR